MQKSKILAVLLVVALAVSMAVASVYATNIPEGACPEHTDVTAWTDFPAITSGALPEGHYKLTADVALTGELTIAADTAVCIDLNGHDIKGVRKLSGGHPSGTNSRVFNVSGTLTVCDSAEEDGQIYNGTLVASSTARQGGNILVNTGATFNLYSGIVTGGTIRASSVKNVLFNGGNIYGDTGSVINIKGGTVSNGTVYTTSYKSDATCDNGGNIATKGDLNISGGLITGGHITQNVPNTDSNRPQNAYGGNIAMMQGSGELRITGGTISNGYLDVTRTTAGTEATPTYAGAVTIYGANIYVNGAENVYIENATISGGQLTAHCENAYPYVKTSDNTYYTGATATARGAGIYCQNTSMTITGNTVISNNNIDITAIGAAATKGGEADGDVYSVSTAGNGGNVFFNSPGKTLTITGNTKIQGGTVDIYAEANEHNTSLKGKSFNATGGNLFAGKGTTNISGTVEISDGQADTAPNTVSGEHIFGSAQGGNIIASETLNISGDVKVLGGKCDYRGASISLASATMTLEDNVQIKGGWFCDKEIGNLTTTGCLGANIFGTSSSTLNVYDNVVVSGGKGGASSEGRDTYLYTTSTINQYGGNLGCTATRKNSGTMNLYNGVAQVWNTTTLNIPDCACYSKIGDTYTVWHPNLDSNDACATCEQTYANQIVGAHYELTDNGSVWECSRCGGTVAYHEATCKHEGHTDVKWTPWDGKTVTSGHYFLPVDLNMGAAAAIAADTEFCLDMNGHTINGGVDKQVFVNSGALTVMSSAAGGNVQGNGVVTAAGAIFSSYGEGNKLNVYDITVNGGTVNGAFGYAYHGGNVRVSASEFYFENVTISNGANGRARGGNIAFVEGARGTMKDCTVFGGEIISADSRAYRGGNGYIDSPNTNVVIDGGTWTAKNVDGMDYGGNLYVTGGVGENHAEMTIQGGAKFIGGKAVNGGNISLVYGYLTLNDCEISGGTATNCGGNIYVGNSGDNYSTLIINEGAVIKEGTAVKGGHDIYVQAKCFISASKADLGETEIKASSENVTIGSGVTAQGNLTVGVTNAVGHEDATGAYTTYATLAEAVAVADDGDTVALGKADTVGTLDMSGLYTLDLNGQTLTADKIVASFNGAKVIDSKGDGLLKVSAENLMLYDTNGYLPVEDKEAGGFRFEVVKLQKKTEKVDENSTKLKFIVADKADETYLDTLIKTGNEVTMQITVSVGGNSKSFPYDPELVLGYASNWGAKMFVCTITGLGDYPDAEISAEIKSKDVVIAATELVVSEG